MHDISRRVYEPDGISPTVHCQQGGNTELKIAENFVLGGVDEDPVIVAMRGRNPTIRQTERRAHRWNKDLKLTSRAYAIH